MTSYPPTPFSVRMQSRLPVKPMMNPPCQTIPKKTDSHHPLPPTPNSLLPRVGCPEITCQKIRINGTPSPFKHTHVRHSNYAEECRSFAKHRPGFILWLTAAGSTREGQHTAERASVRPSDAFGGSHFSLF